MRNLTLLSLLPGMLWLAACSGRDQAGLDPAANGGPAAPGFPSLPQPASLLAAAQSGPAGHSVSLAQEDYVHYGSEASLLVATQNYSAASGQGVFTPNYTYPAPDSSGLAYAAYLFDLPGYDRAPAVRLYWDKLPVGPSPVWVGLANWDTNRWDWFKPPIDYKLSLPAMAPYLSDPAGKVAVVVLSMGTGELKLGRLRIGPALPEAYLFVDDKFGSAPLTVNLDASSSVADEGEIVEYAFDLGDGNGFVSQNDDPDLQTVFTTNGVHSVSVRVTDSQGETATDTQQISAVSEWLHTWGNISHENINTVLVDAEHNILTLGSGRDATAQGPYHLILTKWSPTGEQLWIRGWSQTYDVFPSDAALDPSGELIVVGTVQPAAGWHGLVQKWDMEDGTLLWSKACGETGDTSFDFVELDHYEIYAGGESDSWGGEKEMVVAKFSTTGALSWLRRVDSGSPDDDFGAMAAMRSTNLQGISTFEGLVVGGSTGAPDYNMILFKLDTSGALVEDFRWGANVLDTSISALPTAIVYRDLAFSDPVIYVAADYEVDVFSRLLLTGLESDGTPIFATSWWADTLHDTRPFAMALDPQGWLVVTGSADDGDDLAGFCLRYNQAGGTVLNSLGLLMNDMNARFFACTPLDQGMLYAGEANSADGGLASYIGSSAPLSERFWSFADGQSSTVSTTAATLSGEPYDLADDGGVLDNPAAGASDQVLTYFRMD